MVTAFFRTVLLYFLIIIGLRFMGKRQIGELEPTELVLTMLLSDLASVPMQDFGIPLLNGVIPIMTLLSLSMLLSYFNLRCIRFRSLLCGEPAVIIQNGVLQQKAMKHNRLTVDELTEELRSQGICDLKSVKYAILETNGQLSVLPYTAQQPVTPAQMELDVEDDVSLPTVIVNDGRLIRRNLKVAGRDENWLRQQLKAHKLSTTSQVYFMSVDGGGKVICLPKEDVS